MINRLLGKLHQTEEAEDTRTDEEIAAENRKQRIQWHRDHVRNGPANFKVLTQGRSESRQRRWKKAEQRRVNRRHRRRFMDSRLERAVLRGQLQNLGVIPFASDFQPTTEARISAGQWILGAFGERNDEGELVLHDDALSDAAKLAHETYLKASA